MPSVDDMHRINKGEVTVIQKGERIEACLHLNPREAIDVREALPKGHSLAGKLDAIILKFKSMGRL